MPNWSEVLKEIQEEIAKDPKTALDTVRRKYLAKLSELTGRNVIAYYSGWLQKPNSADAIINDKDKNAFMATIHRLDRSKGLDLMLHTPGGDLAATESIVDYLQAMFGNDIRAIIPQISMSAGTLIAISCKEIMMGKPSNLGPIDPQMGGVACEAVLDEFEKAKEDIKNNPSSAPLWQVIIGKYHPTFLGACKSAIDWSEKLAEEWLVKNMCGNDKQRAKKILKEFSDHKTTMSHARHISKERCKAAGLSIIDMEENQNIQEMVLTTHHAFIHTFGHSAAIKIVENHLGVAYVESMQMGAMQQISFRPQQPISNIEL